MIIPAARNSRRQASTTASLPAPTGGWNARDPVAMMDKEDALQLDNYFAATGSVDLRQGSSRSAILGGTTAPVESLISYTGTHLLAACGGSFYDVTAGGTVTATLATGFVSDRWQSVFMGGYQLLFNGIDTPQKYDGATMADNAITGTGLDPTKLIYPDIFGQRVFMVERDSLNAWYMDIRAISGPAQKLDFSYLCKLGGHLVAIGTWSKEGGNGPSDYSVFVTSMGEVLVYQGYDPANADTFGLVGIFRIGAPIGIRPLIKAGADLIVISEDGFLPLSRVLSLDRIGAERVAISDKIRDAVSRATGAYKDNFGWEALLYPLGNWLLFNVPLVEGKQSHQYVVNTLNNSWCRFIGMDASCWALHGERPYFGTKGAVYLADTGNADGPSLTPIQGDVVPSFQYFASRSRLKQFKMVRPVIASNGAVNIGISVSVDYEESSPASISTPAITGAVWDVAAWDTTAWSTGDIIRKNWLAVSAIGYSATMRMRTITSGISVSLKSIDWLYEPGGRDVRWFVYGQDRAVADWVNQRLPMPGPTKDFTAIGLAEDDKLIAGAIYHNWFDTPGNIQMTAAVENARWATPEAISTFLRYPFVQLRCRRVTCLTQPSNKRARRFMEGIGFQKEGVIRQGYGKEDMIVYGMVYKESKKWLKIGEKNGR